MFRKLIWLLLLLAGAVSAHTPAVDYRSLAPLKPLPEQAVAAHMTAQLIGKHHYRPVPLDDRLSEKVLAAYLKALDEERMVFTQQDVDQLSRSRDKFDDAILGENLELPFSIFNLYRQRFVERFSYARELLKGHFDFQQQETYQFDRENAPWAKSEEEIRELWRKRVKNDWLQLRLTGKDDKKIVETLDKRYENFLKRSARLKSEDAFQIFMNAYTMSVDPHTNYMVPRTSENFDISMRLSLVGIGAVLEEKDDYATIRELVPGSPAALSEKLQVGDRILGVAQGEKGAMTDVVGWRLDDTVALIRGPLDTVVRLDVVAAAAPESEHREVTLVRKKIKLEDQAAKKSMLELNDESGHVHRIGVISLPTFYEDFDARRQGDAGYKSASHDVARLLGELKAEKAEAVLVDLRNNGGGSLNEAIDLTGLFIGSGPVVQHRDAHGQINVSKANAPGVAWDGPLGVLINRASASASEIFAAAVQDYHRGLVIGETSFGKGTVQTIVNLDQIAKTNAPVLGELKLTIAQFFRVNGGTTQLRGVTPDLQLPATTDARRFGEATQPNALPWMSIKAADYQAAANQAVNLQNLLRRHEQRVSKDPDYQNLLADLKDLEERRKKDQISLNEAVRRQEKEAAEAKLKAREGSDTAEPKTAAAGGAAAAPEHPAEPAADREQEDADGKAKKKAKDVLLLEAAHTLADQLDLSKARLEASQQGAANTQIQ